MSKRFSRHYADPFGTLLDDSGRGRFFAAGSTVPADTTAGFHPGCLFLKTGATIGAQLYINEGTLTSSDFNVFNRPAIINVTAATLTVTEAVHNGQVITLNRAAGVAVTLPAATGTGTKLHFICGTTVTSASTTIKVADASDVMTGTALIAQDAADTAVMFETASDSDTITWNGTTTGGIKGDAVELNDVATDLWWVRVMGSGTGTEATPFSATV